MNHSVSVIIPAYNAESTLRDAIQSALSQGPAIEEVIVIVNGCTDSTMEVANKEAEIDGRVIVVESQKGKVPARNKGLFIAKGDLVALLDADDIWHDGKIDKQIKCIDENGADVVGTQILTTHKDGTLYENQIFHPLTHNEIISSMLSGRNCLANSSMIFKRSLIDHIGVYEDCFPFCEDYHFWLRAIKFSKIEILPERLVTYRFEHSPAYDPKIALSLSSFYRSLYLYTGVVK